MIILLADDGVWFRFDKKFCFAEVNLTKFVISMVKTPKIQISTLSARSDHLGLLLLHIR